MQWRVAGVGLGVTATALVGVAVLAAGSGPAVAAPTTLFSSSTAGATSVTVPAGICFVTVVADGGNGGVGGEDVGGGALNIATQPGSTPRREVCTPRKLPAAWARR